jgi:hypothetical protein
MPRRPSYLTIAAALLVFLLGYAFAHRDFSFSSSSVGPTMRVNYPREWIQLPLKEDDGSVEVLFDGDLGGLTTVADPDRLEIVRLGRKLANGDPLSLSEVYPLVGEPISAPDPIRRTITSALLSPHSYAWGVGKNCDPEYHACLSYFRGDDRVDVFVCLGCRFILVVHNGYTIYGENVDFCQPQLLRALRTLFPDDETLKRITELGDDVMKNLRDFLNKQRQSTAGPKDR